MQACTKTHHFEIKKCKNFLGRRHPFPRPYLLGAYGASIFAPTALKLNVAAPKNPSYGLDLLTFDGDPMQTTDSGSVFPLPSPLRNKGVQEIY